MDPQNNLIDTAPGWKWEALFSAPPAMEATWRRWLAEAQRAEQATLLSYWSRRAA